MRASSFVALLFLGLAWCAKAQDEAGDAVVRCKRQMMCKMLCPFGMEMGEDGCPTCKCKPSPCETMKCPEDHKCVLPCHGSDCLGVEAYCEPRETPAPCPDEICTGVCESGRYFHDQHGCQTCDCIPGPPMPVIDPIEPCPVPMCATDCPGGYRENSAGCQTCDCLPLPPSPPQKNEQPCPAVMCAMFCENGFVKDERGCDTCRCQEAKEQPKCECPAPFMDCELVMDENCELEPCELVPKCSVPSFCKMAKSVAPDAISNINKLLGTDFDFDLGRALSCESSGEVSPKQCSEDGSYCWCVDDRGVAIPESKRRMVEGEEEEQEQMCESRKMLMMQMAFQLMHDLQEEDVQDALDDIKHLVEDKVSTWLGMDHEVVLRIQITVVSPGLLGVQVSVMADGATDMPSAALLMHHCMEARDWDGSMLTLGDHTLRTKPGTLQTKHVYDLDEPKDEPLLIVDPAEDEQDVWKIVFYPVLGAVLFVVIIATIVCFLHRRKRSASYQFAHKKMENMENFKKNLILSSEWEKPDLMCKEDAVINITEVEKKPLA